MTTVAEQLKSMKHGESLVEELADGGLVLSNSYSVESYTCIVCQTAITGRIITCAENMDSSRCMKCYNQENDCPVCRKSEVFRNVFLERAVAKLQVSCENDGCKFRGLISDVEKHSVRCDRIDIKCFECEKETTPFELNSHLQIECSTRYRAFDIASIDNLKHTTATHYLATCEKKSIYLKFSKQNVQIFVIQSSDKKIKNDFVELSYGEYNEPVRVPMNDNKSLECEFISSTTIPLRKFLRWTNIKVSGFDALDIHSSYSRLRFTNRIAEIMPELLHRALHYNSEDYNVIRQLSSHRLNIHENNNVELSPLIEQLSSSITSQPVPMQIENNNDNVPDLIEDVAVMEEVE